VGLVKSAALLLVAVAAALVVLTRGTQPAAAPAGLPETLRDTGFEDGGLRAFAPRYPLWTDGASKRRWIRLPEGAAIDASDLDAWQFPVGTKLWKEFAFDGRKVETRYLERRASGWVFATYLWNDAQTEATLAPPRGLTVGAHAIPSEADCHTCHEQGSTPVLGFSAIQLAGELPALVQDGVVDGVSVSTLARPPRIAARSELERDALGYLHAHCGHCHRPEGALRSVGMFLAYPVGAEPAPAVATTVGVKSHVTVDGASVRIAPGAPDASVLLARMRSRNAATQMPPLGTHQVDDAAVRLVAAWIEQLKDEEGRP
jgi:mono/diheme cytochrome c family protein